MGNGQVELCRPSMYTVNVCVELPAAVHTSTLSGIFLVDAHSVLGIHPVGTANVKSSLANKYHQ